MRTLCALLAAALSVWGCKHHHYDAPGIVVNEFKSTGDNEWLELANPSDSSVDLGEFALTDTDKDTGSAKLGHAMRFPKGTSIPAHGYLLVRTGLQGASPGPYGASEDCLDHPPCFMAGFSIHSTGGDSLYVLSPDDDVLAQTPYPYSLDVGLAETACRMPDAAGEFTVCPATPGTANEFSLLVLEGESALSSLLPASTEPWEASGVAISGLNYVIVFDNTASIATVQKANVGADAGSTGQVTDAGGSSSQFEAITTEQSDAGAIKAYYVIKESEPSVLRFGLGFSSLTSQPTDLPAVDPDKGWEGLAWLWAGDAHHLLALCESNGCGDGTQGGVVKVLKQGDEAWTTTATLRVPSVASFADYSDIALYGYYGQDTAKVAIVSQESSAMWLGTVAQNPWRFVDTGRVYLFPRASDGSIQYCNIEGVTFRTATAFTMVSDKAEGDACASKGESIHLFSLP